MKVGGEIFTLLEPLVATLCPPRLVVERAELPDGGAIVYD